jgi:hypothetical protein
MPGTIAGRLGDNSWVDFSEILRFWDILFMRGNDRSRTIPEHFIFSPWDRAAGRLSLFLTAGTIRVQVC